MRVCHNYDLLILSVEPYPMSSQPLLVLSNSRVQIVRGSNSLDIMRWSLRFSRRVFALRSVLVPQPRSVLVLRGVKADISQPNTEKLKMADKRLCQRSCVWDRLGERTNLWNSNDHLFAICSAPSVFDPGPIVVASSDFKWQKIHLHFYSQLILGINLNWDLIHAANLFVLRFD